MDWNSDPELKALRGDFIASFQGRRTALAQSSTHLEGLPLHAVRTGQGIALDIRVIAHNLAGSAGSYGFPKLGKIATLLDDYLSLQPETVPSDRLLKYTKMLASAISSAEASRQDSVEPSSDDYRELISCVESLAAAAKS